MNFPFRQTEPDQNGLLSLTEQLYARLLRGKSRYAKWSLLSEKYLQDYNLSPFACDNPEGVQSITCENCTSENIVYWKLLGLPLQPDHLL